MMAYRGGQVVMPEQPPEKTAVDSFRDLVQAARGSTAQTDTFDKPTCTSVQHIRFSPDQPAITAVLVGYTNGYQVWVFSRESGAAHELVSARTARCTHSIYLLPAPRMADRLADKRPLMAVCCDCAAAGRDSKTRAARTNGPPARCLEIVSLRTGEVVERLCVGEAQTHGSVEAVLANERWLVTLQGGTPCGVVGRVTPTQPAATLAVGCIASVFDAGSLQLLVRLRVGAPSSAVAAGDRWLALGGRRLRPAVASQGGVSSGPASSSYVTAAIDVTKTVLRGFAMLSESVAAWKPATKTDGDSQNRRTVDAASPGTPEGDAACRYGVVSVLDLAQLITLADQGEAQTLDTDADAHVHVDAAMVAHFVAHVDETVQRVAFDASGSLLLTCGASGRTFHVFVVHTALSAPQRAAVHHLYALRRGNTECLLQDVAFAADARFLAATSTRGTVHLFAVAPYGGTPSVRTHAASRVVNRTSQFQRSAGLDELPPDETLTPLARVAHLLNPRRPPLPDTTELSAAAQLHHNALAPFSVALGDPSPSGPAACTPVAVAFGAPTCEEPPRGMTLCALGAAPSSGVDVLIAYNGAAGTLTQYELVVEPAAPSQPQTANGDAYINVKLVQRLAWPLRRCTTAPEVPVAALGTPKPLTTSASSSSLSSSRSSGNKRPSASFVDDDAEWMAQVEIVTYHGPHRRLWMGPQFTFCTYEPRAAVRTVTLADLQPGPDHADAHAHGQSRSSPIEISGAERRQRRGGAVRIEACSIGSAPSLSGVTYERIGACCEHDEAVRSCVAHLDESRIRETLEDALLETGTNDDCHRSALYQSDDCSVNARVSNNNRRVGASLPIPVGVSARRSAAIELELCLEPVASSSASTSTSTSTNGCADKTSSSSVSEAEQNFSWSSASGTLDAAMSKGSSSRKAYRNHSEHSLQSADISGHNMSP